MDLGFIKNFVSNIIKLYENHNIPILTYYKYIILLLIRTTPSAYIVGENRVWKIFPICLEQKKKERKKWVKYSHDTFLKE